MKVANLPNGWMVSCKCGCGLNNFQPEIIGYNRNLLRILSWHYETEVEGHVLSGCRCEKHNRKVGGAPNSYHLRGMAEDITFMVDGKILPPLKIAYIIQSHSNPLHATHFMGIGPMAKSLHLDIRDTMRTWVKRDGKYVYNQDFKKLLKAKNKA